ncbi:MAG: bifunctional nuclease family protein [Gemmatimonadetes bacterium]|nr:bifunctional nuclease family protein [Gemmatimonadota bacterium]
MVEMAVARLGIDSTTNSYVVVLREKGGARILPIWIGRPEAESIAAQLNGVQHERPMTHDLCRLLITGLGAVLRRVSISRVEDNTYFAELHLQRGDQLVQVDARPSDSIAIALRLSAPIVAQEALLVDPDGDDEAADADEGDDRSESDDDAAGPDFSAPRPAEDLSAQQLKAYLAQLRPEDFGKFRP